MARTGMTTLLSRLRRLVDDAGTAVWTNDQLQDVLDEHQQRIWREPLEMNPTYTSGTSQIYVEYRSQYGNYESGGTAYFKVEDSAGAARGTADYTVDYLNGVVTMAADQVGTALYLTAYTYDLFGAAADCWRERAGKVSSYYDFRADGHQMSRSQWFNHCQAMANDYARQAKPITVRQWQNGRFDR